jgi:hypothetical protein
MLRDNAADLSQDGKDEIGINRLEEMKVESRLAAGLPILPLAGPGQGDEALGPRAAISRAEAATHFMAVKQRQLQGDDGESGMHQTRKFQDVGAGIRRHHAVSVELEENSKTFSGIDVPVADDHAVAHVKAQLSSIPTRFA